MNNLCTHPTEACPYQYDEYLETEEHGPVYCEEEPCVYFDEQVNKCKNASKHTRCPNGYIAWHEWAENKSKTHRAVKCPGCGLYKIWVLKKSNMERKNDNGH